MKITNTDGFRAEFDQQKIIDSLMKETGMTVSQAGVVAQAVAHDIRLMYSEGTIKNVTGSLIREWVCQKLLDWGMQEQHDKYVRVGMPVHDAMLIDWGKEDDANENANLGNTPETGAKHKSDRLSKEQYLMMLGDIAEPHKRGDLHVHDLEYLATRQFCQSHDARWFFRYGLWPDGNGEHSSVSAPAQHAEVAILHLVKVLGTAQTQCAGGQGLLYFNTFLAPYLEGKSYDEIHQLMQMFIYECNQMYVARGGQVVFSSINITPGVPALFRNAPAVFKGQISDRTYGEFEREVRLSFKAILEIAKKGDYLGRPFPFPKIEVCIQKEFLDAESYDEVLSAVTEIKDISEIKRLNEKYGMSEHWYNGSETVAPSYKELYSIAYEVAALNGIPYFDNVMARTTDVEMVGCTQCCSFTFKSDKNCDVNFHKKVNFIDDQHFTLGGMQVVTINMPRCAYRANREACEVEQGLDEEDCIRILVNEVLTQVDNAVEIFKKKREWMAKARSRLPFLMQQPFDPTTGERAKVPYINHDELVYELGVVGINEMVQYFTGFQLHENKKALRLAVRIMTEMQVYANKLGKELGMNIVISRTPAETVAQRFAVADLINGYADCSKQVIKGDIETAIKNIEDSRNLPIYYSNGFAPWVGADISLADRLKLEEIFWPICAGGAVTHVWLDEKQTDPVALMDFGMKLSKTKIGYFTFTKDRTQCSNCGYSESGIRETCSKCGSDEVDVISRITGYLSNTKNWNAAKRQELEDRKRVVV